MEIADNSKLGMADPSEVYGLAENIDFGKNCVSDHVNGFQYTTNTESFVIDMDSFSSGTGKEITANSRIPLQRTFSKKGFRRGGEKKKITSNDRDLSSPRGASVAVGGATMLENQGVMVPVESSDKSNGPQIHHQITVIAGNTSNSSTTESRSNMMIRRNSFRRTQPFWLCDPTKIMIFFSTLSTLGTMGIIYLTWATENLN